MSVILRYLRGDKACASDVSKIQTRLPRRHVSLQLQSRSVTLHRLTGMEDPSLCDRSPRYRGVHQSRNEVSSWSLVDRKSSNLSREVFTSGNGRVVINELIYATFFSLSFFNSVPRILFLRSSKLTQLTDVLL